MENVTTGDTMKLRILGPDVEGVPSTAPPSSTAPASSTGPASAPSPGPGVLDEHGYLRRMVVPSRADLVDVLRRWADTSEQPTLASVEHVGGRAHLRWTSGSDEVVVLNADTTRDAVLAMLAHVGPGDPDAPWWVRENANGILNKVSYRDDDEPVPGWYAYLLPPAARPREL